MTASLVGLGPLDPLLDDPEITEVMVNGPGPIWIDRAGVVGPTELTIDRSTLDHLIERIVAPLGRRLDRSSPVVDGRLPDGSRVHVAIAPVALDGPYLTIRRFAVTRVDLADVACGPAVAAVTAAVADRRNIVVSGGTSSGKTTLLNTIVGLVDPSQRIVTIEDAAELRLPLPHVVRLESRPAMVDGPAPVTIRELVRNALRMRPDRIVVGEVRGAEALDMVQAMNTGHEGSLSTVHANSAADAIRRLVAMTLMANASMPPELARELVVSAVDVVVHLERGPTGVRRIVEIAEPTAEGTRLVTDPSGFGRAPRRVAA